MENDYVIGDYVKTKISMSDLRSQYIICHEKTLFTVA